MHAATKALNGHSDVVAGALAGRETDAFWQRIASIRKNLGAILGPFEAYLLMRGMRTLDLRVRTASATAAALARALRRPSPCRIGALSRPEERIPGTRSPPGR